MKFLGIVVLIILAGVTLRWSLGNQTVAISREDTIYWIERHWFSGYRECYESSVLGTAPRCGQWNSPGSEPEQSEKSVEAHDVTQDF